LGGDREKVPEGWTNPRRARGGGYDLTKGRDVVDKKGKTRFICSKTGGMKKDLRLLSQGGAGNGAEKGEDANHWGGGGVKRNRGKNRLICYIRGEKSKSSLWEETGKDARKKGQLS